MINEDDLKSLYRWLVENMDTSSIYQHEPRLKTTQEGGQRIVLDSGRFARIKVRHGLLCYEGKSRRRRHGKTCFEDICDMKDWLSRHYKLDYDPYDYWD